MNINIESIIGIYLVLLEDDNPRLDEIRSEINSICNKIMNETSYSIPTIEISDIVKFIYQNSSIFKLRNDKDGFLRVIVIDSVRKREKTLEKYLCDFPSDIQKYFIKIEPVLVKKDN